MNFFLFTKTCYCHSHKKRKDSLETRAVYIEISLVSWILPKGPKHRGSILTNMASFERDQPLARAFHAMMDKIGTGTLQIAKKWNWKWIFIHQWYFFRKMAAIKASFAPEYVHLQSWSRRFMAKYKDVPTKILKRHATTLF